MAKPPRDIYQEVTDRIVTALEQGTVPWRRPWRSAVAGDGPRSLSTGREYRGVNVFLLAMAAGAAGYSDPRWGTFKSVKSAGGCVRKGEHGTQVILWKPVRKDATEVEAGRAYLLLRSYTVFNAEQCDGLPALAEVEPGDATDLVDCAEQLIADMPNRPAIVHGGNRAAYSPARDMVWLPEFDAFDSPDGYYTTAFHELTHACGHESRCGGLEPATFGSDPYAREELVAEMGAAMLAGHCGLETAGGTQSAAYIASWLRELKNDRKLVIQAAAQAQKRADYVRGVKFDAPVAVEEKVLVAA